ncbi:hypothetical protein THAOC_17805 [Thalassiosira oceanica]|uniref:Uncharacterized protein n=1 Tax=Thalassiosira oceanica TaxID=159749 RepID=K0S9U1_THAOC|nr:hypothetical protein THAOC_17805 [Thalassiosira oceanica]|eukprot:EJK61664.1 hypothetical protein THAOC_17805 [Thalassiosira oceanica]
MDDEQSNGKPDTISGSGASGMNYAEDIVDTLRCENARLRELLLRPYNVAELFRQENARLHMKIRSLEAERTNNDEAERQNERLRTKIRSLQAEPLAVEAEHLSKEVARLREKVRSFEAERTKGKPEQVGPTTAPGKPQTDNSPDISARVMAASTVVANSSETASIGPQSGMASAAPLPPGLSANYVNRDVIFPNKDYPLIPFGMFCGIDKLSWQVLKYKQAQSDDPTTQRYLTLQSSTGHRHHYVRVSAATTDSSFQRSGQGEKNWVEMGIDIMASKDGDRKASARRVAKVILKKYQDSMNQAMDECGYEQINCNPGKDESTDPYRAILEAEVPPPDYINYDGSSISEKANIQWNLMYAEVLKWKEEHGHPNVPARTKRGEKKNGLLNDIGFKWRGDFRKNQTFGGDPKVNRMVAAKVAFPELSFRECMYLGGFEDEELDTVIGPQTWRTYYVTLKDGLRNVIKVFDTRTRKTKAHLNREALVSVLRSEDADRLTKVFGDRAGLFEGFMEKAAERKRNGIDPDDLRASRKRKGGKRKRDMECEQEEEQDEDDLADMEEDEEASDVEAHREHEQEDPGQLAHDMDDQQYQQHLDNWQSNYQL